MFNSYVSRVYIHMCLRVYLCVYIYITITYMYTYTYMYMYTYIYTYTYIYMCIMNIAFCTLYRGIHMYVNLRSRFYVTLNDDR